MPQSSTELNTQYYEPVANGPVAQADISSWAGIGTVPTTIAASGNFTSNVIYADGYKVVACAALSSQVGAITIQRYVDKAGTLPQGAAISATITGGTAQVANANDGLPFQSFKVAITNTSGSVANLTGFCLLLNAA